MDGFFTLDALTPGNGIDDVNVNYTSGQDALIGIEPNAGLFAIPNALTFSGVGESKTFMVRSSTSSQQWSATSNQTWLTVSPSTGDGNVTFATVTATATRNTTDSERTATIIITQGSETATVTVVQPSGIPNVPGCFGETDEYNSLIDLDSSMVVICSEGFGCYTTGHQVTSVKFTTIDPELNPWVNEYNNNSFTIRATQVFHDDKSLYPDIRHNFFSSAKQRRKLGYTYAQEHFAEITQDIDEGEKVRFVSHSMGAAFAEGMADYLISAGVKVDVLVHFEAYQADEIESNGRNGNILTIDFQDKDDLVINIIGAGDINGADHKYRTTSHVSFKQKHVYHIRREESWDVLSKTIEAFLKE